MSRKGYGRLPEDKDSPSDEQEPAPPIAEQPAPKTAKKPKKKTKKRKRKNREQDKKKEMAAETSTSRAAETSTSRAALKSAIPVACTVTPSVPPIMPVSSGGIRVADKSSSSNSAPQTAATSLASSLAAPLPTDISPVAAEATEPAQENLSAKSASPSLTGFPDLPHDSGEGSASSSGESSSGESDFEPEDPGAGPPSAKIRKTAASFDQTPKVDSAEDLPSTSSLPPMKFREPVLSTGSDQSSYSARSLVPYSQLTSREPTPTSQTSDDAPGGLSAQMATLGDQSSSINQPSLGLPAKVSCQLAAILRQRQTEQADSHQLDDVFAAGPSEVRSRQGESSIGSTLPLGSPGEQQVRESEAYVIGAMMNAASEAGLDIPVEEVTRNFMQYWESERLAVFWDSWKRHMAEKYKAKKK